MVHPPQLPGALDLSSAVPYNNNSSSSKKAVDQTRLSPLLVVALVVNREEQLAPAAVLVPALLQWQVAGRLLCPPTPVRYNKDNNQFLM